MAKKKKTANTRATQKQTDTRRPSEIAKALRATLVRQRKAELDRIDAKTREHLATLTTAALSPRNWCPSCDGRRRTIDGQKTCTYCGDVLHMRECARHMIETESRTCTCATSDAQLAL
jgi:hypothetical protein